MGSFSFYREHLSEPWQQKVLDWPEKNGIKDVRYFPSATRGVFVLGWNSIGRNGNENEVGHVIHVEHYGAVIRGRTAIYTANQIPATDTRFNEPRIFQENELEGNLNRLKLEFSYD